MSDIPNFFPHIATGSDIILEKHPEQQTNSNPIQSRYIMVLSYSTDIITWHVSRYTRIDWLVSMLLIAAVDKIHLIKSDRWLKRNISRWQHPPHHTMIKRMESIIAATCFFTNCYLSEHGPKSRCSSEKCITSKLLFTQHIHKRVCISLCIKELAMLTAHAPQKNEHNMVWGNVQNGFIAYYSSLVIWMWLLVSHEGKLTQWFVPERCPMYNCCVIQWFDDKSAAQQLDNKQTNVMVSNTVYQYL